MRASDLIRHLVDAIAADGDREVHLSLMEGPARVAPIVQIHADSFSIFLRDHKAER